MLRKVLYLFLLLGLSIFYVIVPLTVNKAVVFALIILAFVNVILFASKKEKNTSIKGQFLKHSTFILIGYFIVHFQYEIDYLLGNVSINANDFWVNKAVVIKSLTLSVIGLVSFILGYSLYQQDFFRGRNVKRVKYAISTSILTWLALFSLIIYFITVNRLYLAGFYGVEGMGTTATYAVLAFTVITFAALIQNCRNMVTKNSIPRNLKQYIKSQGLFLTILIAVYLLSVMISGDRGPIITLSIAYFSGYFIVTKKKMSWKTGVILIVAGATFMSLLGIARSLDKEMDFSSKILQGLQTGSKYQETSFLPATQELAGSVKSLHTTVNYIPEKHDFLYGRFQFQQFMVAVPFFNVFNSLIFDDNSNKYNGSASFVTWINQGDHPTSGEGTTCVADFYFDFGLTGVIIGMFLFGYCMRLAEVNMYGPLPGLFMHAFVVVYLSYAIYIARSSFLFNFRTVFWVFLVLVINQYLFNRKPQ